MAPSSPPADDTPALHQPSWLERQLGKITPAATPAATLESWLRGQPLEVQTAFGARAALRALPIVWTTQGEGFGGDFLADIVLRVFEATSLAWAVAAYPGYILLFSGISMECGEYFAIPAATIRTFTPIRDAFRTRGIIRAVNALFFALDQDVFGMHSVGLATSAATSAAYIPYEGKDKMVVTNHAVLATRYAAHVTHTASFWSAVAFDMARAEDGATASVIAGLPLWPQDQAELLESLWQEMKAALLIANQDTSASGR